MLGRNLCFFVVEYQETMNILRDLLYDFFSKLTNATKKLILESRSYVFVSFHETAFAFRG